MTDLFDRYCELDALLAKTGHPTPPWWMAEVRRFYRHPTARLHVAQVGRGGAKSTTAVRMAAVETLYGDFTIPEGEVHYFAFISTLVTEAAQRLRNIEAILRACGIQPARAGTSLDTRARVYIRNGDVIDLPFLRRGFRVIAASVAAASGFRAIGWAGDEVAKQSNTGTEPIDEVLASARAMTVTHPTARGRMFSSPMATHGVHFKAVALGDTEHQIVSKAASWIANPGITEAETHRLEPDERVWKREYLAVPQAGALSAFDSDAVDRAFVSPAGDRVDAPRVFICDPSSGRKDAWTWARCGWSVIGGKEVLCFDEIDAFEGSFWRSVSADQVVAKIAESARQSGIRTVHADQREGYALTSIFQREKLFYKLHDWSASSKPQAVERVRRWFADGRLLLPRGARGEKLRTELLIFEELITSSGAFTFGARGSGHDDYVALLMTAALADMAGDLYHHRGGSFTLPTRRDPFEPPMPGQAPSTGYRWTNTSGRGFG